MGKDNLYALPTDSGFDQSVERQFMADFIDAPYHHLSTRLISDPSSQIQQGDREILARYFLASYFRTPWAIEEIRPQLVNALFEKLDANQGVDIDDLSYIPKQIRDGFHQGNRDIISAHAALVAVCMQIAKSELFQLHASFHYVIFRLTVPGLTFITGDRMMLIRRDPDTHVMTHIAPMSPDVCLFMSSDPSGISSFADQAALCELINQDLWNAARSSVIGYPNAPVLRDMSLIRGDGRRP
jgi:hypothetical protein